MTVTCVDARAGSRPRAASARPSERLEGGELEQSRRPPYRRSRTRPATTPCCSAWRRVATRRRWWPRRGRDEDIVNQPVLEALARNGIRINVGAVGGGRRVGAGAGPGRTDRSSALCTCTRPRTSRTACAELMAHLPGVPLLDAWLGLGAHAHAMGQRPVENLVLAGFGEGRADAVRRRQGAGRDKSRG